MQGTPDLATLHRAADRGGRRTGLRAALFLALAIVAAVGSALLLTRYMDARAEAASVPTAPVVVAAADLPVGAELRPEHLRVVRWPASSRPEGVLADPAPLLGKVVGSRIYRFEPILPARLAGAKGGLSALLPPGMRAVAVRVDDVVGVAGFIHPGDTVDVIVTLRSEGGRAATSSKVILQNIRVLSVGTELDGDARKPGEGSAQKRAPSVVAVATLQVDADQSERLALAAAQGKLLLTLRSAADAETVATKGMTPDALLDLPKAEPPPKPVARVVVREPEKKNVIEILRGDLFERRNFDQGAGAKK